MKNFSKDIVFKKIGNISPNLRKLSLILIDILIIPFVLFFGFWIKHEVPFSEEYLSTIWIIKASFFIGIPIYIFTKRVTCKKNLQEFLVLIENFDYKKYGT